MLIYSNFLNRSRGGCDMTWLRLLFMLCNLLCSIILFVGCSGMEAAELQLSATVPFEPEETTRQFSKEELIKDLDQLKGIIGTIHPKSDRFISEEDLGKMIETLKTQVSDPMPEEDFYRLIAPVIAAIGCTHTYMSPSEALESALSADSSCIPFDLKIVDNKLYVIRTFGYKDVSAGDRVVGINGIPADEILHKLLADTPTHGLNQTYKLATLNKRLSYYFLMSFGQSPSFTLDLVNASGEQHGVALEGISVEDYYKRIGFFSKTKPCQFRMMDKAIGYLKISDFMMPNEEYVDFLTSSFRILKVEGAKSLIVDLRGNGGGDPTNGAELLSYIAAKPFPYFAAPYAGLEPLATEFALKDDRFDGKVYVLMDGACASTTGHVLSLIQYHQMGILMGEEAGSTFTCNNASVDKVLNVTKTKLHIARRTYETAVKDIPDDRGLMPAVAVSITLDDIIERKDAVLEKALELAQEE